MNVKELAQAIAKKRITRTTLFKSIEVMILCQGLEKNVNIETLEIANNKINNLDGKFKAHLKNYILLAIATVQFMDSPCKL